MDPNNSVNLVTVLILLVCLRALYYMETGNSVPLFWSTGQLLIS